MVLSNIHSVKSQLQRSFRRPINDSLSVGGYETAADVFRLYLFKHVELVTVCTRFGKRIENSDSYLKLREESAVEKQNFHNGTSLETIIGIRFRLGLVRLVDIKIP